MIGKSLSLCVMDILEGRILESEVQLIITSTKIKTKKDLMRVLSHYAKCYWEKNPKEGKAIAMRLWIQGKIHQPRLYNDNFVQDIGGGVWIKSLDDWKQGQAGI